MDLQHAWFAVAVIGVIFVFMSVMASQETKLGQFLLRMGFWVFFLSFIVLVISVAEQEQSKAMTKQLKETYELEQEKKRDDFLVSLESHLTTIGNLTFIPLNSRWGSLMNPDFILRIVERFEQTHPQLTIVGPPSVSEKKEFPGLWIYHRPKKGNTDDAEQTKD